MRHEEDQEHFMTNENLSCRRKMMILHFELSKQSMRTKKQRTLDDSMALTEKTLYNL